MTDRFALGDFIARWSPWVRHDLSASECTATPMAALLALAEPADQARWESLDLGYAAPRGAAWLRATIAASYDGLDADDIVCGAGAQEAVTCVMRSLLTRADHAVVVLPIYQPLEQSLTAICRPTGVVLRDHGAWQLDLDEIAAAIRPETKLILTNFPNSPTGATLSLRKLEDLIALCRRHGLWLVNDEVYRLTADPQHAAPPVATLYERGISIDAVSKSLGLPGLRVGWVVCRDRTLLAQVLSAKSGLSSCLAAPSEVLAQIALRAEPRLLARNRQIARRNRTLLQAFLDRHPTRFAPYRATNDAFALPHYLGDEGAAAFAEQLVRATGVLVLPSSLWATPLGPVANDYLRFGLGRGDIAPALAAIDAFLTTPAPRPLATV